MHSRTAILIYAVSLFGGLLAIVVGIWSMTIGSVESGFFCFAAGCLSSVCGLPLLEAWYHDLRDWLCRSRQHEEDRP